MITLISAINKNNIIWKDNNLLYYIPKDLKRFKSLTLNKTIVMGKKTWDSLPEKFKPLPNRKNIILSRDSNLKIEWAIIYNDIEKLIQNEKDLWIIGGAQIYNLFIKKANKLEITLIFDDKEGNVKFPIITNEFKISKKSDIFLHNWIKYQYITYFNNNLKES